MGTTTQPDRFGTFQGVFRPTFLTIVGALLYLREGWLVGNSGLGGGLLVIGASVLITGTTALSVSSIATNQRVRAGGAFAIISQALGLEAGGAIGVPLYIAQALSAAMYAYGFAEAFRDTWAAISASPPPALVPVALVAFLVMALLSWRSAAVAFRAQAIMLVLVVAALLSLFSGAMVTPLHTPTWLPVAPQVGLLRAFAIFFPAATGIMVGIGMSGQLADPVRSIPRGTLWGWGTSTAIYVLAAVWYSAVADPQTLMGSGSVAFDHALLGWVVRLGLLTSTLMATLSSLVASSRLLQALAENGVIPRGAPLAVLAPDGEPRRATVVTALVAATGLLSGSLDAVAPIITAFFVLTFLALNIVVILEQRLGMISFRPTFRVAPWVPVVGVVSSGAALFLASPRLILVLGILAVLVIYGSLVRRSLDTPWETVRSGIDVAVASWAARRVAVDGRSERAWKPDLLVPVTDAAQVRDLGPLLTAVAGRYGSVKLLAVGEALHEPTERLRGGLTRRSIYATATTLRETDMASVFPTVLDAMQGDVFPPNLIVLDAARLPEPVLQAARERCQALRRGFALYVPHPKGGLGEQRTVDVWLSDRAPEWSLDLHTANLDLPVLVGLLVAQDCGARLHIVTALRDGDQEPQARRFLRRVKRRCRLPVDTDLSIHTGAFLEQLRARRPADLHLFGMPPTMEHAHLLAIADAAGGACLFLMDSGTESALA